MKIKFNYTKTLITEVQPNDYLQSMDETTKIKIPGKVNKIIKSIVNEQYKISFMDNNYIIVSKNTGIYRFDSLGINCVLVDQLNIGDSLLLDNGEFPIIKNIEIGSFVDENFIDFNIEDTHNFYVTGNKECNNLVLSHNSGVKDGAMTTSLSAWHMDIFNFLKTQQLGGEEREKCMDLYLQLVANDKFMKAMENDEEWYLFDPYEILTKFNIDLGKLFGNEFEEAYNFLVSRTEKNSDITDPEKRVELYKKVRAKDLFKESLRTSINRGTPYWAFKDNINNVSNMKNAGTIYGLNLCLTGDTKVQILINDTKKEVTLEELGELYKKDKNIMVLSKNIEKDELEYKLITDWFLTSTNAEVYEIEHPNGQIIRCTGDHKIYTKNRGYVKASELLETDELDKL